MEGGETPESKNYTNVGRHACCSIRACPKRRLHGNADGEGAPAPVAGARDGRRQDLRDGAEVCAERGSEGRVAEVSPGDRAPRAGAPRRADPDAARSSGANPGPQDRARHGPVAGRGHGGGAGQRRQGAGRVRRMRVRCARRGEGPLELAADRRGGEEADRRRRQGDQGGVQGGRGPGGRALLPFEGLAARALDAGARPEGRAAAAGGKEARQDGDRPGPRRAGEDQALVAKGGVRSWVDAFASIQDLTPGSYFSACSTARFAMTVIRCARYSGEACRSLFRPSGFTLMFATDSGANFEESAFSMSV